MSTAPQVSVILPFYHVESQVFDAAIASIAAQTLPDWELILVNNNAATNALAVAENWLQKDVRIRLIAEPQQGIAFALNKGLQEARGELIARMDADDYAHPQRLAQQVGYLKNHLEIDVVSTQTSFASALPQSEGYDLFVQWQNSLITPEAHALARFMESPLAHPTVMFRKSLIEYFGAYSTEAVPEDYELWLRWMDAGVQFYKIPAPLLTWHDHAQRLSRNHANYSTEAFWMVKCRYLARWLQQNVPSERKIIICGAGRLPRQRADLLRSFGIEIFGFTDVKMRKQEAIRFVPLSELVAPGDWFILSFISKRGVGEAIAQHFSALGFVNGQDFLIC